MPVFLFYFLPSNPYCMCEMMYDDCKRCRLGTLYKVHFIWRNILGNVGRCQGYDLLELMMKCAEAGNTKEGTYADRILVSLVESKLSCF